MHSGSLLRHSYQSYQLPPEEAVQPGVEVPSQGGGLARVPGGGGGDAEGEAARAGLHAPCAEDLELRGEEVGGEAEAAAVLVEHGHQIVPQNVTVRVCGTEEQSRNSLVSLV